MAFQIQDDILDYTRTARTGKPANNDLHEGKITLPLLAVLERCDAARSAELLDLLGRCAADDGAVERLQSIVEEEGGIDAAAQVMHDFLARAAGMLAEYAPSEAQRSLIALCAYVAERDR